MKLRRALLWILLSLAATGAALWLTSRPRSESLAMPAVGAGANEIARGAAAFAGAGFGGVSMESAETHAVPWRLVTAALVLNERRRDPSATASIETANRVLARFGFLPGAQPVNLPDGVAPFASDLPLGFTYGDLAPVGGTRVRIANLGCAACHAGVTYSATGEPQPSRAMAGMPNTSINLEAYTLEVFDAMRRFSGTPELLATVNQLYPGMGWRERATLRFLVLPLVSKRLAALGDVQRPLPFPNGSPGSTNGVPALKAALGTPLASGGKDEVGIVSVPDLGHRTWRTNLLADGVYGLPDVPQRDPSGKPAAAQLRHLGEIVTFFTVPSMGVHPDAARQNIDAAADIMAFLESYRPQPFPGKVETRVAAAGAALYARDCAACHGTYDAAPQLTSFPNWRGDVGTDPLRAALFDQPLQDAIKSSPYRSAISINPGAGYVAPPLTGIWASAPFLHNGSVATLMELLTPEARRPRFQVGGHALDFVEAGIRLQPDGSYPSTYTPFSTPVWTDTGAPGYGNAGHRFGEHLSREEKLTLIEFLKLL